MRLLFDNNLSHRLVKMLSDIFPDSSHVMLENLDEAKDDVVWEFAKNMGFSIVTKDSDFLDISTLLCFPPKVIYIKSGNCRLKEMESILRNNKDVIVGFLQDESNALLEISA